jgi:hypothetical protein
MKTQKQGPSRPRYVSLYGLSWASVRRADGATDAESKGY